MDQTMAMHQKQPVTAAYDGNVTTEKIIAAVEQIVRLADPLRVIAFGSRARGPHRRESDLDLAIIVRQLEKKSSRYPVMRSDLNVSMSVDILVVDQDRHEFMKGSIISVHHDIATKESHSMTHALDQSILELLHASQDDEQIMGLPVNDRSFGFHAQQSVEKLLKALIGGHVEKYEYTHDPGELLRHAEALEK
jgi:predicted nucleotidyltransferase